MASQRLATAFLAELDDQALAELARRLAPHLAEPDPPAFLTARQAADRLAIHPKTLARATREGRVRGAQRVGGAWRFDPVALELLPPVSQPLTAPRSSSRRSSPTTGRRRSTAAIKGDRSDA